MKCNQNKIYELTESYINGNISYVKGKVKTLNKVEFVLLCTEITYRKDNVDIDQIAFRLTSEA